jgi:hypothetical protein
MSERNGHPSVLASNDIEAMIRAWPELQARVTPGGGTGGEKTTGSKKRPAPIDAHVVDVMVEVEQWVHFCARVLIDEVPTEHGCNGLCHGSAEHRCDEECDQQPTSPDDCPDRVDPITSSRTVTQMREIVAHVGHFTEHEDQMLAMAFCDDAERLRKLVEATARPSGRRRLRIGARCFEKVGTDTGARVKCPGHYTVLADPDRPHTIPDIVCDVNSGHRIEPVEWQRAYRRMGDAEEAVVLISRWRGESVDAGAAI